MRLDGIEAYPHFAVREKFPQLRGLNCRNKVRRVQPRINIAAVHRTQVSNKATMVNLDIISALRNASYKTIVFDIETIESSLLVAEDNVRSFCSCVDTYVSGREN